MKRLTLLFLVIGSFKLIAATLPVEVSGVAVQLIGVAVDCPASRALLYSDDLITKAHKAAQVSAYRKCGILLGKADGISVERISDWDDKLDTIVVNLESQRCMARAISQADYICHDSVGSF